MKKVNKKFTYFLSSKHLGILHKIFCRCFTQLLVLYIILFSETIQLILLWLNFLLKLRNS